MIASALTLLLVLSIALCNCENSLRADQAVENSVSDFPVQEEAQRKLYDVWNPSQAVDLFPFSQSGGVRFSALTGRWYMTQGSLFMINNQFCNIVDYDSKGLSVNDEFNNRDLPIRVTVSTRLGSCIGNLQQSMGSATNQVFLVSSFASICFFMLLHSAHRLHLFASSCCCILLNSFLSCSSTLLHCFNC